MSNESHVQAKSPFYIHFTANFPGFVSFSKNEYEDSTLSLNVPFRQLHNITQSIHSYMDRALHEMVDLSEIDAFLKNTPVVKTEGEYHRLIDFYNAPALKELVKKVTEKMEQDDKFELRELMWVYIARMIFRGALIQTDYATFDLKGYAVNLRDEDDISDFGRELM